jgi:hypothetical protein
VATQCHAESSAFPFVDFLKLSYSREELEQHPWDTDFGDVGVVVLENDTKIMTVIDISLTSPSASLRGRNYS